MPLIAITHPHVNSDLERKPAYAAFHRPRFMFLLMCSVCAQQHLASYIVPRNYIVIADALIESMPQ